MVKKRTWMYNMHRVVRNEYSIVLGKPEEKSNLGDLGVDV
jgi:hypothetical protein